MTYYMCFIPTLIIPCTVCKMQPETCWKVCDNYFTFMCHLVWVWVWYHYIGGDYSLRLNIMLLVKCQWQTCCLSCKLMGWYVTSEIRAKIRPADWRRASDITGGISCWAGSWVSGSWPVRTDILSVVES